MFSMPTIPGVTAPLAATNESGAKRSKSQKSNKSQSPVPSYRSSASSQSKASKKESVKFVAAGTSLRDVFPSRLARAEHHLANFVHRDRVVKYAAAIGLGGAVTTGILMAVGVIKVAAIGAFFASPVGHGVAIGIGAAVGAYLLYRVGKFAYGKMKQAAKVRLEETKARKEQAFEYGHLPAARPPMVPQSTNPFAQFNNAG